MQEPRVCRFCSIQKAMQPHIGLWVPFGRGLLVIMIVLMIVLVHVCGHVCAVVCGHEGGLFAWDSFGLCQICLYVCMSLNCVLHRGWGRCRGGGGGGGGPCIALPVHCHLAQGLYL